MTLRLFSIENMPRELPIWDAILEDLGRPSPERISRALGVGRSTVFRWQAAHSAPRAAALALFWLTRWGRSVVDAQATNDAVLAVDYARALAEERLRLMDQVRQLEDLNGQLLLAAAHPGRLHDSGATDDRSHTGTADAGRPWAPVARSPALPAWPRLDGYATDAPGMAWPVLMAPAAAERPSSPEALPQAAHSWTAPGGQRRPEPPPSVQPVAEESLPSLDAVMLGWRHFATTFVGDLPLLVLRQAPQQPNSQQPTAAINARARSSSTQTTAHAGKTGLRASLAALLDVGFARPGTPASASLAALSSHGGSAPIPPPGRTVVRHGRQVESAPMPPLPVRGLAGEPSAPGSADGAASHEARSPPAGGPAQAFASLTAALTATPAPQGTRR